VEGQGWGVRYVPYDFYRSVLRCGPVLPRQQQSGHDAPEGCDDGEIAGKLSRGAKTASGINTWYSQERHVGSKKHGALEKWEWMGYVAAQ
jgi:hypothetical protein